MKQLNLFLLLFMTTILVKAQETVVNLSMQPDYSQEVYFDFSTGQSENYDVDSWDIAFLRTDMFDFGERINDGLGIEVYEVSSNPNDWNNITPADIDNNTPQYYNSDTEWESGAFDQGSATYGWGEYNGANHHVDGKVIYILKYPGDSYKKFMIEDFSNGYTFKYASWNESNAKWINENTDTLSNDDNKGKLFNFYSLSNDEAVIASPDLNNWDLVFQKYTTDLGTMYPVQGALQNPNVEVAISTDPNAEDNELNYHEEINTVGYDWKEFDGTSYTVDSDTYYFLKKEDGSVYRFHFLSYDGASTGDFSLGYEDVTHQMDIETFDTHNYFSIYPNPTTDRTLNILYKTNVATNNGDIAIYDLTGRQVYHENLKSNGFYNQTLDLSALSSGTYILKFNSGEYSTIKKLILK